MIQLSANSLLPEVAVVTQEVAAVVGTIVAEEEAMAEEGEAVPLKVRALKMMLRTMMEAWSSAVMMMHRLITSLKHKSKQMISQTHNLRNLEKQVKMEAAPKVRKNALTI